MENMKKIKRELLIGLPVIEKNSEKKLGIVQDLYLTDDKKAVDGLIITNTNWIKKCYKIPFSKISSIGTDAIVIDWEKVDECAENIAQDEETNQINRLIGLEVMTPDGNTLGSISDLVIDPQDGSIESMELSDGFVDDLMKGRGTLPWYPPDNEDSRFYIISEEHANELSSYEKGIKNIFLNKIKM